MTVTCPICGHEMPDDPGAYYHRKGCERRVAYATLAAARESGADAATIRRLEREYEMACYVGD